MTTDPRDGLRVPLREACASLDEMLSPAALSAVAGRPVRSVRREAFEPAGWSSTDARFERIFLDDARVADYVVKSVIRDRDWVALATDDRVDREVRIWEAGLLDRLPAPAAHATLAAARWATGYALLMPDLSASLLSYESDQAPPVDLQRLILDATATIHATFWMDASLADPRLGLATLGDFVRHLGPAAAARARAHIERSEILDHIEQGWARLPDVVGTDLATHLRSLADDPRPVMEAASAYPWTLTHTDVRVANLAIVDDRRVSFLDWARPAVGPPAIDLVYWLRTGNQHQAAPHEELVAVYEGYLRERLGSAFDDSWWQPQLELCAASLTVAFAPFFVVWWPDEFDWWVAFAGSGLQRLL